MAPVSNTSHLVRRTDSTTRSIAIGLTIGLALLALTVVITWVMHCQRKKLRKKVDADLKEIRGRRAREAQNNGSATTLPQYSENAQKDDIPLPSFEASMPQQPQQQSPQQQGAASIFTAIYQRLGMDSLQAMEKPSGAQHLGDTEAVVPR
ncbi:hypothetical protein B0I35DRAFT_465160 [Stachybotrys elegans]|uniref:Uncharacterized protein n=1 Tax=Stachybotrys elegans TaxID=80388 RepID=A0A8K0SHU3_9HYPO|nr:hypothetical protein B0I35DRAFT_465160 [Stachybotrys elegans]